MGLSSPEARSSNRVAARADPGQARAGKALSSVCSSYSLDAVPFTPLWKDMGRQ